MKIIIILFLTFVAWVEGCNNPGQDATRTPAQKSADEMIAINRSMIADDREAIDRYVRKSSLKFSETPTGMRYSVITGGSGKKISEGDNVTYDYECTLLDGTVCYRGSRKASPGFTALERGVTEGLLLMSEGSEYILIIPPYLAYGLTGDGDRIPGRAILSYRIRITGIN